jgi:hypothetical protein
MRKFLVLIASVALLAGACGNDKKSDSNGTSGSDTSGGLRSKLLTAAELPPDFKRTDVNVDDRSTDPIGCPALDQVDEQYLKNTEHTIDATFQNGDDETATQFLQQTIYSFKTEDEANAYFDGENSGIQSCKTFSQADEDGTAQSGHIAPYSFAAIGDESAAASISYDGSATGGPIVMVRKGSTWMGIVVIHLGNEPGLTGADLEALVRKAADKL